MRGEHAAQLYGVLTGIEVLLECTLKAGVV
jgi:hypothetical protein